MKLHNAALVFGFLLTGSLPWFTLGPASTLGITGWSAGLTAVLASVLGLTSGVLNALAAKGMPTRSGAAGPRLGAFITAIGSLTSVIVWLSTSSNTQAAVGNDTMLLHYGPGSSATVLLAIAAVGITAYELITSNEPIPPAIHNNLRKVAKRFGNSKTSTGAPNTEPTNRRPSRPQRPRDTTRKVGEALRQTGGHVGEDRERPQTSLHLPQRTRMHPPEQSEDRTTQTNSEPLQEPEHPTEGDAERSDLQDGER